MGSAPLFLLGLMVVGSLILEGYDYGVGMLLAFRRDQAGRDTMVHAIGPFFLGNEVWPVAVAGLLLGSFPDLEARLIAELYPGLILVLVAWLLRDAGLWFRRYAGPRAAWDRVIAGASLVLAFGWGVILGSVAMGGTYSAFRPGALLGGVLVVALCLLHGAAFLELRLRPRRRQAFVFAATALAMAALVLLVGVTAGDETFGQTDDASARLLTAVAVPVLPILLGSQVWLWWSFRRLAPGYF